MINSLQLQNFKSWKNAKIEFHKGVNAIIGKTDHGKTNIIRAIKWVVFNRRSGKIESDWGGETQVTLETELENKSRKKINIARIKTKTKNQYLYSPNCLFSSFGQDVPNEIEELLNITDINFQRQHDAPFLLSQTSGEVARYFNQIVQLDKIDSSLSNIASTIRREKADLEHEKEKGVELERKLDNYIWLEEAEGCIVKLENFQAILTGKKITIKQLIELKDNIQEHEQEIDAINKIVQYRKEVDRLIELQDDITYRRLELAKLETLAKQTIITHNNIEDINKMLEHESEVNRLIIFENKIQKKRGQLQILHLSVSNIRNTQNALVNYEELIEHYTKEFNELMPNSCPLCGGKIKK